MSRIAGLLLGVAVATGCATAANPDLTPRASAFRAAAVGVDQSPMSSPPVAAPVGFFGISVAEARRLVVVIDRSIGGELPLVQAELVAALDTIADDAQVAVVCFGDGAIDSHPMTALDDRGRRALSASIDAFGPASPSVSGSGPAPAMERAYAMKPERIILVAARLDRADGQALLSRAVPEIHAGVRIDTVGVGVGDAGDRLAALAEASGGDAIER